MDEIQNILSITDTLLSIVILIYALAKMSAALTHRTDEYTMHLNNEIKYYRDTVTLEIQKCKEREAEVAAIIPKTP